MAARPAAHPLGRRSLSPWGRLDLGADEAVGQEPSCPLCPVSRSSRKESEPQVPGCRGTQPPGASYSSSPKNPLTPSSPEPPHASSPQAPLTPFSPHSPSARPTAGPAPSSASQPGSRPAAGVPPATPCKRSRPAPPERHAAKGSGREVGVWRWCRPARGHGCQLGMPCGSWAGCCASVTPSPHGKMGVVAAW